MIAAPPRPKIGIRYASREDRPRIVEMAGHFIELTAYRSLFTVQPELLGKMVDICFDVGVVLVAVADERIVGMIAAHAFHEPINGIGMVDELAWWMEPEYRKGRLGPQLLWCLEKWALEKGLSLCKMIAPVGTDVGRFYARLGYTPVETAYIKRLR